MTFRKGQSGNPGGKPKQRKFREALSLALSESDQETGLPKIRRIADKLVDAAMKGESWAIREIADRTDGKAVQAIDLDQGIPKSIHEYTEAELHAIIAEKIDEVDELIANNATESDSGNLNKNNTMDVQNNDS